jgi:hypothetical protein
VLKWALLQMLELLQADGAMLHDDAAAAGHLLTALCCHLCISRLLQCRLLQAQVAMPVSY